MKNLKKDVNHVNLTPFNAGGTGERDSWSNVKPSDLLLAFHDARMSPLQRRSYKMCFLGSNRDPTWHSSKVLSVVVVVAQKANKIVEVKLPATWAWGLKPYDRNNQVAEVCLLDATSISLILGHQVFD
jgi:hypothetical protein